MELEASPVVVYTVREFREDQTLIEEHIFVGNLLDETTIKALNTGRKSPSQKDLKGFFTEYEVKYNQQKFIQRYHPVLLEFNDTFNDFNFKIGEALTGQDFYLWSDDLDHPLTHKFLYRDQVLKLNPSPFSRQENLDRVFTAYGNLNLINQNNFLIRTFLRPDQNAFNLITGKTLRNLARRYLNLSGVRDDSPDLKVITNRYLPNEVLPVRPYFSTTEVSCLNQILRDTTLPVNDPKVMIDQVKIEQCTIHINRNDGRQPFINLETVFQLIPMDDKLIFTKLKRGDRSISKVSKKVKSYKSQVTKDDLAEWTNIEEHHRGLMYRKLKTSPGLVIYRIYENGFIELQINWATEIGGRGRSARKSGSSDSSPPSKSESVKSQNIAGQLTEIISEIQELNEFIRRLNLLSYQLPDQENQKIQLADDNFLKNPTSNTSFTYFNFKTWIDTNKQQIIWNRFNYLVNTFGHYLQPIFSWKVFNQRELKKSTISNATNLLYLKTNNNLLPDNLFSVLYSLGLVGNIDKEQTVRVDQQKDLIIQFQDRIYPSSTVDRLRVDGRPNLDLVTLEEKIRLLKEGNPGVMINLKFDGNYYVVDIKGAHNLWEVGDINFLMLRLFGFYFHTGSVFRHLRNYNCQILRWILNSKENEEEESVKQLEKLETQPSKKTTTDQPPPELLADPSADIFDVEALEEEEEPELLITPPQGIKQGEFTVPTELMQMMEDEEDDFTTSSKKIKSALDYLKEVSPIFKTEYRRHGCTSNLPVVITKKDFWHNYSRLIQRFQGIKNTLKQTDITDYQKKFQKEIDSQDPDLIKFKKRVEYVTRKITNSSDKKILEEIADIADRYNKGALMKVPMDKKKTKYSREYFYICPYNWCAFCRESRLSDEIDQSSGAHKALNCKKCGNKLYSLPNPKNSFIGFPSSKKYPHINCLPCCFKNESKFKKKISECDISHPIKNIPKIEEKNQMDLTHILTGDVIPPGRYGYLDGEMTGKLNDFFNGGTLIDKIKNNQDAFLRRGVNLVDEKDAFIEALSYYIRFDQERVTPEKYREALVEMIDMRIFWELNNGLIATIFKTPDNTWDQALDDFKLYLLTEHINEDILWHLTSYRGAIDDTGYNLLIIHRSQSQNEKDHKYTMLCPLGMRMEDYFDPNKLTGIMLKLDNNMYYPIVKVTCSIDFNNIVLCTRSPEQYIMFSTKNERVVGDLYHYAVENCTPQSNPYEKDRLDLYQTIEELDKTQYLNREELSLKFNPYLQIIAIELKLEGNKKSADKYFFLPIKSTPLPMYESDIESEFDRIDTKPYKAIDEDILVTIDEMTEILNQLIKKTKIPLKVRAYVKNSLDEIYAFKLDNGLLIIFKSIPLEKFKKRDHPIILEEDPNLIDMAITKNLHGTPPDKRQNYVNKTTFQKEAYQRLRFEISRLMINEYSSERDEILKILNNNQFKIEQKRSKIEKIVDKILKEIAVLTTPDLTNYQLPQIRVLCGSHQECTDHHCFKNSPNAKCKVVLPQKIILPNNITKDNTFEHYVVLLSDEILRNVVKRLELLDGKVSIYVNPSQMVYDVDREILIDDLDYQEKIKDLYARSTDYLDLLKNHYFLKTSEVFTREVEQNLYYFADDSWYKNTGMSRNDFVMNSKNIYDMLFEVLAEDVGEQIWNFIDKNNWKLWLNSLRDERFRPDEYQNIYQYSQFREHIKYERSVITDIHLSLISRLNNVKLIIMNKNAVGSRKFHCLNTTQTTQKKYLILYRYSDEDIYLVGKTPHLDLTNEKDVEYMFSEDKLPKKFFQLWYDQCKNDHKLQQKPDSADYLITDIEISPDYDLFIDDLEEKPDIRQEKIIKPPIIKMPSPPRFSIEEDELDQEDQPATRKESPPRFRKKQPSRKKPESPPQFRKKQPSRKTSESPPRFRKKQPSRKKQAARSRTASRKPVRATRSRTTSRKKNISQRGRSRSVSRNKRSMSVPGRKKSMKKRRVRSVSRQRR